MLEVPKKLDDPHEFISRTALAIGDDPYTTADGRLQPQPEPGCFEIRVSRGKLDPTLRMLQAIIDASLQRGLVVAPVERGRGHRAGVGIGKPTNLAPIWVDERRVLVVASDETLERWRSLNPRWAIREEDYLRRGFFLTGSGNLRIRLARRHDWPASSGPGWRCSYSDQVGRPLFENLEDVVNDLEARAEAGP